jgi:hypothetical protein
MRLKKLRLASLALAATAIWATQAQAAFVSYNDGDLLLGFEQNGTTANLVVNLGSIGQFTAGGAYYSPGVGVTVAGLSSTDLSNVFTASWNSNVQTNLVRWGLAGRTADGQTTTINSVLYQQNTLFLSRGRTTVGTQSVPFNRTFNGTQATIGDNISGLGANLAGLQSTVNSSQAGIFSDGPGAGWTSYQNGTNSALGFDYNANLEQPLTGSATGPTNSVLDLYRLNNTNNTSGPAAGTYLGSFALNNAGVLSFTAAAVPEPSTYVSLALGLGLMGVVLHRRRRLVSV